jgi:hypothetical protein
VTLKTASLQPLTNNRTPKHKLLPPISQTTSLGVQLRNFQGLALLHLLTVSDLAKSAALGSPHIPNRVGADSLYDEASPL